MLIFFIKCITVFNIAFMPRRYILDIINFQKDGNKMDDNINKTEFDKVFKLMKESFPESEYQTYEKQQKLLNTKEYKILTKYDENKNLIAFMALWDFPELVFIEHLAVSPLCRGGGIGTKFMKEVMEKYNKQIILEIEPPKNDIAAKRCRFYERLGFSICDFEYYQKPLRENQPKLRLNLMSYPEPLDKNRFEYVKDFLYRNVYKYV